MSQFEQELRALEATRCPTCKGSGQVDDAEPGDIYCRTWTCKPCGGTGKKREAVAQDDKGALYKDDLDADALRDGFLRRSRT